jgi:CDI toxin RNase A-like protein
MNISEKCLLPIVAAAAFIAGSCSHARSSDAPPAQTATDIPPIAAARPSRNDLAPVRDLSRDESMGGHTLARHVGKTDTELATRLRREPDISSASTYTDRLTAEHTVTAALASAGNTLTAWLRRTGRRPNLVLHFTARDRSIGRSLSRGRQPSVDCNRAIVVLRWDERANRFYVLTSYPEAGP